MVRMNKIFQNRYFSLGLVVAIIVISVFVLMKANLVQTRLPTRSSESITGPSEGNLNKLTVGKGDLPPLGSEKAPIIIVEFGDFLCPFCARTVTDLYPQLENLIQEGKVAIYFRDFVVHPEAIVIHNAARCANDQGKYWEFNKEIFKKFLNGETITKKDVWLSLAKELGLNLSNFNQCLDEKKYFNDVRNDTREGYDLGVRGTPTFFINGQMIEGINIPVIMSTVNQFLNQ